MILIAVLPGADELFGTINDHGSDKYSCRNNNSNSQMLSKEQKYERSVATKLIVAMQLAL